MSGGHAHALHLHGHSPVHRLEPEMKVAALFGFVAAVVVTPREAMWAFGLHAVVLAAVMVVAEVPPGFLLKRMVVETPFVLFALFLPVLGGGERVQLLGFSLSIEGLWGAWNILAKASLGIAASVLLLATTEIPHVLRGLERLRTPKLLVAIAGFMVRYLDVVAGELGRMRTAMTARGYDPRWIGQVRALGTAGGALFIRSYERGERVYHAMTARGYQGTMPRLDPADHSPGGWRHVISVVLIAWLVTGAALVT